MKVLQLQYISILLQQITLVKCTCDKAPLRGYHIDRFTAKGEPQERLPVILSHKLIFSKLLPENGRLHKVTLLHVHNTLKTGKY